jgi:soluble lytic murein transglycosylase-like protein
MFAHMPAPSGAVTGDVSMAETSPIASDRRAGEDRRTSSTAGRRGAAKPSSTKRLLLAAARDMAAIVVLIAAIVYAVRHVSPIFAGQPKVAESLANRVPVTRPLLLPTPDTSRLTRLTLSPEFEADRTAFAEDLARTGRMSKERADTIAYYAVREAYDRGIPPAVIFGVMLTENALFVSDAMSNVGAVGLMQIYPKIWLKELGDRFGTDLASDSTNVKYGVYILSEYIKPKKNSDAVTASDVNRGLLRYNGCVRGTNTPNCRTYPSKVKKYVEKQGESLCGDKSFYACIAKPFMDGLMGRREGTD